jgi:GcrA cell cycle regulator
VSWTDERIATLKKMWLQGKSASEIAEKLGGVTRNAVIGKAHRLNLSGRPSPIKKVAAAKKPAAPAAAPVKKASPAPAAKTKAPAAPTANNKPLPAPMPLPKIPAPRVSQNGPGKPAEVVQLAALANASSKPDGSIISILELNERTCRWPVGDPREGTFGYCGSEVYGTHPYCAEHVAIAFQAPNRKDKKKVNNAKAADVPEELEDLEVEVDEDEEDIGDDTLVEDDMDDDDTPLV